MPGYVFGDLIGTRGQQKSPPTSQAHVSELAGPAPGVRTVYTPAFFAPEAMVGRYMRRKVAIRAMRMLCSARSAESRVSRDAGTVPPRAPRAPARGAPDPIGRIAPSAVRPNHTHSANSGSAESLRLRAARAMPFAARRPPQDH